MGFTGFVNESHYNKQNLSQPYKFLVHSVIHAMGHRKGGYDVAVDYIMCMVTTLILNHPYNYSQVIFEHKKANAAGEKFLKYPRFIQMILDDKIKNLEKNEKDDLVLDHMTNATLECLHVYKKKKPPPKRRKFACIEKPDYVGPSDNKWHHDYSDSGNEDKQMELFESKRSKWFINDEEKKKKGKRGTPKKATTKKPVKRQLIDESSEDEAQNVEENVETGAASPSTAEVAQEIEDIVFRVTENVGDNVQAGDMNVEGIAENVEGVESFGSSDIDATQIAPTTGDPMAKWRKKKEKTSKTRENSDDEDATYEPSDLEARKMSERLKSVANRISPNVKRIRKSTTKVVNDTSAKVPETREPEVVEASPAEPFEIPILTPPRSPIQQMVPIQTEEVQQQTPPQKQPTPQQGSTSKKTSTPQRQRSGDSFPNIPEFGFETGPVNIEDIPNIPFFDDGRPEAVEKRVAKLEKGKNCFR
ncbi:hypothetical protein Hdeb2414_s0004g00140851 [Helianthus debilis subsp. tardiflorus]